jgi:hypothetical protein
MHEFIFEYTEMPALQEGVLAFTFSCIELERMARSQRRGIEQVIMGQLKAHGFPILKKLASGDFYPDESVEGSLTTIISNSPFEIRYEWRPA